MLRWLLLHWRTRIKDIRYRGCEWFQQTQTLLLNTQLEKTKETLNEILETKEELGRMSQAGGGALQSFQTFH